MAWDTQWPDGQPAVWSADEIDQELLSLSTKNDQELQQFVLEGTEES